MAWMNEDGLYVKFGVEKGKSLIDAGEPKTFVEDGSSVLTLELNLAELTTAEQILSDVVWLPKNAQINWIKVKTEVLGTTGTSIDVGLIAENRATELDYDGLLAAYPLTGNFDATGDTVTFYENTTVPASMTGTGALVGSILPNNIASVPFGRYYVTASYAAGSAFGAGRLHVMVGYTPNALADNAN